MRAVLASQNKKKIAELQAILGELGVEVLSQQEAGVDLEVEETGTTFEENARLKARAVMEATGLPAIADDSGLMVDALDGAPGVYSARYGGARAGRQRPLAAPAEKYGGADRPGLPLCLRHLLRLPRRGGADGPGGVPRRGGPGGPRGRGLWL